MTNEFPIRVSIMEIVEFIAVRNGGTPIARLDLVQREKEEDYYAAEWVSPEDAAIYDNAADELLRAIMANRLPILGQKNGIPSRPLERVPAEEFSELRNRPLADTSFEIMFGERRYLDVIGGEILNRWEVYWSGLVALRDDLQKTWPSTSATRAGRPESYDWSAVEKRVFELMDYHGDFDRSDRQWNAQARLEAKILTFCATEFGEEPSTSTLRPRLRNILEKWRRAKAAGGR